MERRALATSMAELSALKCLSKAREEEQKRLATRRRDVLVLILRHLVDNGYVDAYERLSSESSVSLNKAGCRLAMHACNPRSSSSPL